MCKGRHCHAAHTGDPGNNLLPAVAELAQIVECGALRGALASLLGADYILHPHRCVSVCVGVRVDGLSRIHSWRCRRMEGSAPRWWTLPVT